MDLTSDLRTAIRMTLRNLGTSSLIVFTLALAIAAATIGFAFADLALLRGLPVDEGSKVASISASDPHGSNPARGCRPQISWTIALAVRRSNACRSFAKAAPR